MEFKQQFVRKVDKSQIPTCNILGVEIAAINMEWLVAFLHNNIKDLSGDYMTVANVHTTVTATEDKDYLKIQNNGIMAIPDGGPLSSVGRKRGFKEMQRTTGPSLMDSILKISKENGYRHFFYGSTPETIEKMKIRLKEKYGDINIVGMFSPPFKTLSKEEDLKITEMINETKPDFVWVGLGAPKQERWMADHQGKIVGLMIGVGAGFDYLAGNIKRAPLWMQKANMEWIYRLIQNPKLFHRYFSTNFKFLWKIVVKGE